MPMLLSQPCHEKCVAHGIKSYLDSRYGKSKDRALAWDYLNLTPRQLDQGWDVAMDEVRSDYGHDRYGGNLKKCRFFYHFLISPDPLDNKGLEDLRELATTWAAEMFGGNGCSGRLGTYQVAICYHDDNTNNVPHAHLIVNCTDLESGNKLNMNKQMGEHVMPDRLQEIAKEMGYSYFDNTSEGKIRRERSTRESALTKYELLLQNEMKWSWKQEFRDKINIAKLLTHDSEEFVSYMDKIGVKVTLAADRQDWILTDKRNERWAIRGGLLGKPYSEDRIVGYLGSLRGKVFASRANRENARDRFAEWVDEAQKAGIGPTFEVADALECTQILKKYGIEVYADFEATYRKIRADKALAGYSHARTDTEYDIELKKLQSAEQMARRMRLLHGAVPKPSPEMQKHIRRAIEVAVQEEAARRSQIGARDSIARRQAQQSQQTLQAASRSKGRAKQRARQEQHRDESRSGGKSI